MNLLILVPIAIFAVLIFVVLKISSKKTFDSLPLKFYSAKIADVSAVFDMLQKTGREKSYAIFAFNSEMCEPDSHIELQFSVEDGQVGFDWILLGEEKQRDKEDFMQLALDAGYQVHECSGNNVAYLRVTKGNLVSLCISVMKKIYKAKDEQLIEVIAKEFQVTGLPRKTH